VVIIIALIVLGVLSGIPGIGGRAKSNSLSSYWETSEIGVSRVAVTPDGNVSVTLTNNMRNTIEVTSIKYEDAAGNTNQSNFSVVLAVGQSSRFTVNNVSAGDPGAGYTYTTIINYTNVETDSPYSFTGQGNRLEGSRTN
jgi:hypothetical protein